MLDSRFRGNERPSSLPLAMHHPLSFCLLAFVFGYLCGSIPFGVLLTRVAGGPDLRSIGSGNIGATNVLAHRPQGACGSERSWRHAQGHRRGAASRAMCSATTLPSAAAVGAFLGHVFPVWLRFRGGKGVATYIGMLLGHRLASGHRLLRCLARGRGRDPLFVPRCADCQRGGAGFSVVAWRPVPTRGHFCCCQSCYGSCTAPTSDGSCTALRAGSARGLQAPAPRSASALQ